MTPARSLPLALLAVSATGCGGSLSIDHEAALYGVYRDATLGDDAADVHARFAEPGSTVGSDVVRQDISDREILDQIAMPARASFRDVTEKGEIRVLYIERPADTPTAGSVLIATTTSAAQVHSSDGAALFDAVLTSTGVAVAELDPQLGCVVRWLDRRGEITDQVELDAPLCTESLRLVSARPGDAIGYSNGTSTGIATPEGSLSWDGGGDLVSWDPLNNAVVVAVRGQTEVRAWLDDGTEVWYTDIGQSIEDLDSMGAGGALALATTVGSNGRIVLLDSVTGDAITAIDVPLPGLEISAGSAGTHIALVLEEELHLFSVDFSELR